MPEFELEITLTDEEFKEQMSELFSGDTIDSKSRFETLKLKITNSSESLLVTATYSLTRLDAEMK